MLGNHLTPPATRPVSLGFQLVGLPHLVAANFEMFGGTPTEHDHKVVFIGRPWGGRVRLFGSSKIPHILKLDRRVVVALQMAERIASGPAFANMMTKNQLNQEWSMTLDQAIESEAQAQAICMQSRDFERAYQAFVNKQKPVFKGD